MPSNDDAPATTLKSALQGRDEGTIYHAVTDIRKWEIQKLKGNLEIVEALTAIAVSDQSLFLRLACLDLLGHIHDQNAAPFLEPLLEDQNPQIAKRALDTLYRLGSEHSAAKMLTLLTSTQDAHTVYRCLEFFSRVKVSNQILVVELQQRCAAFKAATDDTNGVALQVGKAICNQIGNCPDVVAPDVISYLEASNESLNLAALEMLALYAENIYIANATTRGHLLTVLRSLSGNSNSEIAAKSWIALFSMSGMFRTSLQHSEVWDVIGQAPDEAVLEFLEDMEGYGLPRFLSSESDVAALIALHHTRSDAIRLTIKDVVSQRWPAQLHKLTTKST